MNYYYYFTIIVLSLLLFLIIVNYKESFAIMKETKDCSSYDQLIELVNSSRPFEKPIKYFKLTNREIEELRLTQGDKFDIDNYTTDCMICEPGEFIHSRGCKKCEPNSITTQKNMQSCYQCAEDEFTNGYGDTECRKL